MYYSKYLCDDLKSKNKELDGTCERLRSETHRLQGELGRCHCDRIVGRRDRYSFLASSNVGTQIQELKNVISRKDLEVNSIYRIITYTFESFMQLFFSKMMSQTLNLMLLKLKISKVSHLYYKWYTVYYVISCFKSCLTFHFEIIFLKFNASFKWLTKWLTFSILLQFHYQKQSPISPDITSTSTKFVLYYVLVL